MTAARTTISKHYRRRGRSTATFHHSAPTTTQTAGTTAICSASVSYLATFKKLFSGFLSGRLSQKLPDYRVDRTVAANDQFEISFFRSIKGRCHGNQFLQDDNR